MSGSKKNVAVLASLLLILTLASSAILPGRTAARPDYPLQATDMQVASALDYLQGAQMADGGIGGFGASAWATMAIAAAGRDPHDWGNPSIVDYLAANAASATSATDYARMILAIVAAHEDPESFGSRDFISLLKGQYNNGQIGDPSSLSDDFWGVMALISAGENSNSEVVASSVAFIRENQNPDGGWSWAAGGSSDVDMTAAAIMALIAAGENPGSSNITGGLGFIRSTQNNSGGFLSWGTTNPSTDSWAMDAIVAAGQDPGSDAWTNATSGKTPINDLLSFQNATDGSFPDRMGNPSPWVTSYAIPSLLGQPYPVEVSAYAQTARWPLYTGIGIAAALLVALIVFLTQRRRTDGAAR